MRVLACRPCTTLHHPPDDDHPEKPSRITWLVNHLSRLDWIELDWYRPREDTARLAWRLLERVHGRGYLEWLRRECRRGPHYLDEDAYVTPSTLHAVVSATATIVEAVGLLASREEVVVALVRPPSHHAGPRGFHGFCVAASLAAALLHALEEWDSIAVVDVDAHYGDGVADVFYDNPRLLYVSVHEDPRYAFPFRGYPEEHGRGPGRGYTINIPLPVGATDKHYRTVFSAIVEPVLEEYNPGLVVVAYGSDAHWRDELTDLMSTVNTYYMVGESIRRTASAPVLVVLEGGYEEWSLTRCMQALLEGLTERPPSIVEAEPETPREVDARMRRFLERVLETHKRFWRRLGGQG